MFKAIGKAFGTKGAVKDLVEKADELHLSDEEKMKLGVDYLNSLSAFKLVQRIIVACVMAMWLIIGVSIVICIWLQLESRLEDLMAFAMSEFIWMPSSGLFALYLLGGILNKGPK